MILVLQWAIPLVCLGLIAFAFFAPRKEDRKLASSGALTLAPGAPLRVTVAPSLVAAASVAHATAPESEPHVAGEATEPDAESEPAPVDATERLRRLQAGERDLPALHNLLTDPEPRIRSAALDLALAWHDLDAVSSAMADPIVPIAARAAYEYAARTSQAACDAELSALDPAHALKVRRRLAELAL